MSEKKEKLGYATDTSHKMPFINCGSPGKLEYIDKSSHCRYPHMWPHSDMDYWHIHWLSAAEIKQKYIQYL